MLLAAFAFVRRFFQAEAVEGGLKLDQNTGLPSGVSAKIVFADPSAGIQSKIASIDEMLTTADAALKDMGATAWILLDRLDVAFSESVELEENALRALFKTYLDFLEFSSIRLKLFLRTDIWKRITAHGFREASHITRYVTLDWNQQSLLNLVVRRAVRRNAVQEFFNVSAAQILQSAEEQQRFFYRLFPEQIDVGSRKPETLVWMLARISDGSGRFAPRELIHLINHARDLQLKKLEIGEPAPEGESLFSRASIREALGEVSTVRIEQTLYAEYPVLKPFIEALQGEKTQHTPHTLAALWKQKLDDAVSTANKLAEIGFFGRRGTKDAPEYWVPPLFRDGLGLVQGRAE